MKDTGPNFDSYDSHSLPEGMFVKIRDILVTKSSIRSDGSYMIKVTKDELTLIDELFGLGYDYCEVAYQPPLDDCSESATIYLCNLFQGDVFSMKTIALQIDNSDPNLHPEVYIEVEDSGGFYNHLHPLHLQHYLQLQFTSRGIY